MFWQRKIKLDENQHNTITGMADELGLPKEEVLWMMVDFGMGLAVLSQENKSISDVMTEKGHLPEYKNWERIAKLSHKNFKAGAE